MLVSKRSAEFGEQAEESVAGGSGDSVIAAGEEDS